MALHNEFIEAVKNGDKLLVRIKLAQIITIDPTLKAFGEMKLYAEQHITDLYDVHSGELNTDSAAWTEDYYISEQTKLDTNFSRERLKLLCDMAKHLYGDRINTINNNRAKEKQSKTSSTVYGAVGGAVLGGIVAAIAGKAILGGVLIGGVIGAVIGIAKSQDKK